MKSITIYMMLLSSILSAQQINIKESAFTLDGLPFDMWGLRVASASQSEANTTKVIKALNEYQEAGINTISVFIQGSSGGYSDPFHHGGSDIDPAHWNRLTRIIEACQRRRMVVIVGIFYQRTLRDENLRNLNSAQAIVSATRLVAQKLKPYKNVILNIANEQNSRLYQGFDAFDFNYAGNIIDLCREAKMEDPNLIVGAGGYNDSLNVIIGKSSHVDVLLFDTFSEDISNDQHSGWHYDHFRAQGVVDKPLVNVEIFGGWTRQFLPQGVYTQEGKDIHLAEIQAARERPGLYVHFHSNPWFQALDQGLENQFHLGGQGTEEDPGVRWFFEAIPQPPVVVNSLPDLQDALTSAGPGDLILLAEGNYEGPTLTLSAKGTEAAPIVIRPKTDGKVTIRSPLKIEADYLTVEGLQFADQGHLEFQGRGCRLSGCSFSDVKNGKWVRVLPGSHQIEIDHNRFENKTINRELTRGCQLMQIVVLNQNERHHIHHNLFKDIPQGSGNGFETLQLITKNNPFDPAPGNSNTVIENNLFIRCNGEAEIISVKSNGNLLRNNTFRACRGSLVLRHGDDNVVTGNFFFGEGEMGSGGIRLQGSGQVVANNYFHGLGQFGLGMMDGTPDDLYVRVERALILFNSFIDCKKTFVIGLNHSKHPNGTVPRDCHIIGNLMLTQTGNPSPFVEFVQNDQPENWQWKGNVAYGAPIPEGLTGVTMVNPHLTSEEDMLFFPSSETPKIKLPDLITEVIGKDLFGSIRKEKSTVGAIQFPVERLPGNGPLNVNMVGPAVIP